MKPPKMPPRVTFEVKTASDWVRVHKIRREWAQYEKDLKVYNSWLKKQGKHEG